MILLFISFVSCRPYQRKKQRAVQTKYTSNMNHQKHHKKNDKKMMHIKMFPEPPYINEIEKSMPIFSFDDSKFNLKKDLDKYVDEVLSQNHEKMKIHLLKARNLKKLGLPSTLLLGNIDDKDILSLVVLDNASNHKS